VEHVREHIRETKKNRKPMQHLVLHTIFTLGLVSAGIRLASIPSTGAFALAVSLYCIAYFRSFAIMHDAVHGCVSDAKIINDGVGVIFGAICFLPYWPWRQIHIEHHQWTGNVDKDPVMKLLKVYPHFGRGYKNFLKFNWRFWVPYMGLLQHTVFWGASWARIRELRGRKDVLMNLASVVCFVGLYGSMARWAEVRVMASVAVGAFFYMIMVEVVNFPHHLGFDQHEGEAKFKFSEQHQFARSCHYTHFISHHVLNNFNYHVEHHMFPHVPWYELRGIRDLVKPALGEAYHESHGSTWILENRKKDMDKIFIYRGNAPVTKDAA
jgi:fatty acid desaturase